MARHLYANFLNSEEEYRLAVEFWRQLIDQIATESGQEKQWTPWQSRTFLDGSEMPHDGNPIYDARSAVLGRAIRIIQTPPTSDSLEMGAWLDTFDYGDAGGPSFTEELVLNLALSEESAAAARSVLAHWMDRSISRERMEDILTRMSKEA